MRYLLLLLTAIFVGEVTVAQPHKTTTKGVHKAKVSSGLVAIERPPEVFTYVEQHPEFQGGAAGLDSYLDKTLQYPDWARENNVQGKVLVRFMVDESGAVTNVKVMKGIGYGCDQEAARVVKAMPLWRPGKINGRAVKTVYVLPVAFKIM